MHTEIALSPLESAARKNLAATLTTPVAAEQLDASLNMRDAWGLTSLNKILFITSLCNEMDISLGLLTEEDLANMHSLADVCQILNKHSTK
ncbi:acyl carrier protein [Erwinia psidii]|uniref:acyl carrier protein n=1 Tax=Erwinia psidii TaxID=69224 RepID=UPI00226B2791|nr:acyl carrier protein [Erwinia psidii]MCX8960699.1 acyl carrier protein [Erwinia psidii]